MKRQLMMLLGALPFVAAAQTFDFDMTKPQPVYSADAGYGYDILPAPTKKTQDEPFYFSVKVDDGNYRVKVELGSKKRAGETTVRAEGRRLMVHNCATKKGKFSNLIRGPFYLICLCVICGADSIRGFLIIVGCIACGVKIRPVYC